MNTAIIQKLAKSDKILGKLIGRIGPLPLQLEAKQSTYEALIQAVTYQQLTGKAAEAIFARFKALYPNQSFPSPQDLLNTPDEQLRLAGISRPKIRYLRSIAEKTLDGTVPANELIGTLEDTEIYERLMTISGVGQWTIDMILIFKLGRPDVLPALDYALQKGFALTYGHATIPKPKTILEFGERWRPYRTTASLYLWRTMDLANG